MGRSGSGKGRLLLALRRHGPAGVAGVPCLLLGPENWPPEDEKSMAELCDIARTYIVRRQHHASLLLWCGGNELQGALDGGKKGVGRPVPKDHPLMVRWARLVAEEDPGRRFLESSSSGPRFVAAETDFGKGLHWDIHGPWDAKGDLGDWRRYWENEDALFRSETGCPSASPADIIREFKGNLPELPGTVDNPLWRRASWWIQWPDFVAEHKREPRDLEEFGRLEPGASEASLGFRGSHLPREVPPVRRDDSMDGP